MYIKDVGVVVCIVFIYLGPMWVMFLCFYVFMRPFFLCVCVRVTLKGKSQHKHVCT